MADALLAAFTEDVRRAARQRKSDDIIAFIKKNWRLFCATKTEMEQIVEELEGRGELTVTSLADALCIPEAVMFKKVKVVDTAELILRPRTSSLYKLFQKTLEQRAPSRLLCLFVVAGDHTLALSNLRVAKAPPGKVNLFISADDEEHEDCFLITADTL